MELARRRHWPSLNWSRSYSHCIRDLEPFYEDLCDSDSALHRAKALEILAEEERLKERISIIGMVHDRAIYFIRSHCMYRMNSLLRTE